MSEIDPNKYIVFNRAKFKANVFQEVRDAVVIRTQDIFAPAGLRAYASTVLNTAEIVESLEKNGVDVPIDRDHCIALADYFMSRADEAERSERKFPD